jgi:hypothetical protein
MDSQIEYVELELRPIPPDTVASVKQEISDVIEQALRDAGQEQAASSGQIEIEVERTFPVDEAIIVGLTFLAGIGIETYKFMLDVLRERYEIKERERGKRKKR